MIWPFRKQPVRQLRPAMLWDAIMGQDPLPSPGLPGPAAPNVETVFREAVRRPRALSAADCPELHEIHRQMDERKAVVEGRIAVLTAELDRLKAERDALVPAWNCLQGWVGVHQIQPLEEGEEVAA